MRWGSVKAVALLCLSGASATFWPGYDGGIVARNSEAQSIHGRQGGGLTVTTDGMCGNGTTCEGSGYGACCSYYYWCGNGDDFCGDHCRSEFGRCGDEAGEPTSTTTSAGPNPTDLTITTDGMCGNGTTCLGSTSFGRCCSYYYWCGDGEDFCGDNCRSEFGWCDGEPEPTTSTSSTTSTTTSSTTTSPTTTSSTTTSSTTTTSTTSSSTTTTTPTTTPTTTTTTTTTSSTSTTSTTTEPTPTGDLIITSNGMCGNGTTCAGSGYGSCCSLYYWCGTGDSFCGDGCREGFGECGDDVKPPVLTISTDGLCGNGTTCAGSEFGDCCSDFYYCGTGNAWCGPRCRPEWGECT